MPLKMGSSGVCAGRCLGESRRNSVHKCPKTASRGRFSRSVYTPAYPRLSATVQQCTQVPRNGPERPFLPICVHSCVAAHGEASRGGFDGVLARRARSGSGNARTGGEAETPRWVSDDLFLEAGDRPGPGRPERAPRGVALRGVPAKGGRAAASRLVARHTPRHVSCQLTEQGHPARAISPKPARARICRQRCSRSPQRPLSSR